MSDIARPEPGKLSPWVLLGMFWRTLNGGGVVDVGEWHKCIALAEELDDWGDS